MNQLKTMSSIALQVQAAQIRAGEAAVIASLEGTGLVTEKRELQGHMYIARKPCGKVVASCWDDAGLEKETAESVARWIRRGDKVERVARYKDDPMPDWACPTAEGCACRTPPVA